MSMIGYVLEPDSSTKPIFSDCGRSKRQGLSPSHQMVLQLDLSRSKVQINPWHL